MRSFKKCTYKKMLSLTRWRVRREISRQHTLLPLTLRRQVLLCYVTQRMIGVQMCARAFGAVLLRIDETFWAAVLDSRSRSERA